MKLKNYVWLLPLVWLFSCDKNSKTVTQKISLSGTWQLVSATTITKGVSETTDYTKNQRMIKILNDSHFSFLKHDLQTAKDSANHFDGGGGRYTLNGNKYTEYLDFYSNKNWENKRFDFTVALKNDTLIQQGTEKVEKENINRTIIEKYIKLK